MGEALVLIRNEVTDLNRFLLLIKEIPKTGNKENPADQGSAGFFVFLSLKFEGWRLKSFRVLSNIPVRETIFDQIGCLIN